MNRLKSLREQFNMTQSELGKVLHVKDAAISKYESGKVPLTGETLLILANYFNVSTDYLLGRNDNEPAVALPKKSDFFFFFDDMLRDVFTSRLTKELTRQHLSKEDFSNLSAIELDTCVSYLSGDMEPTIEDLITISRTLGVSTDYLIGQCTDRADNLMSVFKDLNGDNRDIIIGEAKKLLKEQRYEDSVAAESKMKEAK